MGILIKESDLARHRKRLKPEVRLIEDDSDNAGKGSRRARKAAGRRRELRREPEAIPPADAESQAAEPMEESA